MLRIAICDDSLLDREIISELLLAYFSDKDIEIELKEYENGAELFYDYEDGISYDIILLDIYMDKFLGIDVARKLREKQYCGEIIFLTASADFALEGYDVKAAGYLLKPHSYKKLGSVLDRIIGNYKPNVYKIIRRKNVVLVPYDEITYVESNNTKCVLHRNNGDDFVIYKKLSEIESELKAPCFLRCHQSYLVNMNYICSTGAGFELTTGDTVLIRQRELKAIKQKYLEYINRKNRIE